MKRKESLSKMALVMLDYDGVIVNTLEIHVSNLLEAFHENAFYKVNSAEEILKLYERNVYQSLADLGLNDLQINQIFDSYEKKQNMYLDSIEIFNGIADSLREIARKNKIYIITSNVASTVIYVLKKHGLTWIENVLGSETEKSKIKKIRKVMTWHPELTAYYVGDTKGDIFEGQTAGAYTIGVAWGWHDVQKLLESCPDYIVHTPQELAHLFQSNSDLIKSELTY
jgi:phosphoglycolate phosphatase